MAILNKTAMNVKEMLQSITSFLIDSTNFTTGNAWTLVRPAAIDSDTTEIILKGLGDDGNDEIYVGMKIVDTGNNQQDILLNGYAGYDENLHWWEQPGCIPLKTVTIAKDGTQSPDYTGLPCIPLAKDVKLTYWVTANSSRISIRVKMSYQYEAAYLGFFKPVSIEHQYPYPMAIGGSAYHSISWNDKSSNHSIFLNPYIAKDYSSLILRLPDGSWKYVGNTDKQNLPSGLCIYPTDIQPISTFTVLKKPNSDPNILEDNMLYPFLIYQTNPHNILGEFDGLYWVGNLVDLAAEDNTLYKDKTYKIFNNIYNRDNDAYHALEWM